MSELWPKIGEIKIKSSDSQFGFADTFSYIPFVQKEKDLGNIFIVAEVNDDPFLAIPVIETLFSTFKKEYYASQDRDIFESFKTASQQANETLSSLAEKGNVSFIGNLHAIIAAQKGNEIHLTAAGKARAFLIRNNQKTEISEDIASPDTLSNPLKTFTDVTSGEVMLYDKFLFTTPLLFELLPDERIYNFVSRQKPDEAALSIKLRVDKLGANINIGAFIIEIEKKKEEIAVPIEVILSEEHHRKPKLSPEEIHEKLKPKNIFVNILSGLAALLAKLLILAFKGIKFLVKNIFKGVRWLVIKISQKIKERKKKGEIAAYPKEKIAANPEEPAPETPKKIGPNEVFIKEEKKRRPIKLVLFSFWKRIPRSSKIFLITSLIFAVLFAASLILLYQKKKIEVNRSQIMDLITLAENKLEKAETSLIYDDEEKARNLLNEAAGLVKKADESKYFQEEIKKLTAKIQEKQDTVNHIVRVEDVREIGNFSESFPGIDFNSLTFVNDKFYTFNPQNNAVYRLDPANKEVSTVSQTSTGVGYFKKALALSLDKAILFFTGTPGLAMLDTKNNDLLPLEIKFGDKERDLVSFTSFQNRLYFLDRKNSEVLSFAKTLSGYTGGSNWLKDKVDLGKTNDIAVDGYVYILFEDGRIEKYLKGVKKEFKMPSLSEGLSSNTKMFLNENIKHIYILDPAKKRVVVLDTTGNLKNQYLIENAKNLKDIFVDNKEEKIYLLDEGKILEIEIK